MDGRGAQRATRDGRVGAAGQQAKFEKQTTSLRPAVTYWAHAGPTSRIAFYSLRQGLTQGIS